MSIINKLDNSPLKIAAIMDRFGHEWIKYECILIPLNPDNWMNTLMKERPDLLLIQTTWYGVNNEWTNRMTDLEKKNNNLIKQIVRWCNNNCIPTVFWNLEDPYHFVHFIEAAKEFDYIFTTDSDSISEYNKIVGHNHVYSLPFAVQPKMHNPINKNKDKIGKVGFAGTWYPTGHDDRKRDMKILLEPALKYGLHIYDRMYGNSRYKFPEIYQPHIKPGVPYSEIPNTYKKYEVFLNVNTIQNSPTMFSFRVLELLACGITAISGYALGIEKMLGGLVPLSKTKEDTVNYIESLLNNKELRDRLSVIGQREVFGKHTIRHRLETILDVTNIPYIRKKRSGVSIITCTNREDKMEEVINNFVRQSYKDIELIVVINNDSIQLESWEKRIRDIDNIRVFKIDEDKELGECLNFAMGKATYSYVSKFDDDNYYAPHFIEDLMYAFEYSEADIVGKLTYYTYFESNKTLAIRFPKMENRYVNFLCGSAFIMKKDIWNNIKFSNETVQTVTTFFRTCVKNGIKLYSADRFNYVYVKHPSVSEHIWKIEEEEFLRKCQLIGYTNNYSHHISV